MKKTLLFVAMTAAVMFANAQGTWKATGTEVAISAATEISFGITGLKSMHSDAATIVGKGDTGAETVSYNEVTYDNLAFIQGSTNGMYYAFLPAKSGTLDIAVKMGSGKKTFILELTDALWTSLSATAGDLAALTSSIGTADGINQTAEYFTLPSVYDTYNKTNGTWDGNVAIQSTGGNVYMVMSFPVTAKKTYVVGCFGSKMMLRGINFIASASTLLYSNDFENGVGDATIVGSGQVVAADNPGYGHVFHNALGGQGIRTNYLLLPEAIFNDLQASGSKELSIAFWVNKGTAVDFYWSAIFSAYGAAPAGGVNTWPMMALMSRLWLQVNCAGWTDFTAADNVHGANTESTVWLDDGAWHYYTVTFTESMVKVYIDGVVQNAWTLNGTDGHTVSGLFTNASDLNYICLGGNQAWNWADPDPAYQFDDVTIYSINLTSEQIDANIAAKKATAVISLPMNDKERVGEEYFLINGMKIATDFNMLKPGVYIKRILFSDGTTGSSKIVKMDR